MRDSSTSGVIYARRLDDASASSAVFHGLVQWLSLKSAAAPASVRKDLPIQRAASPRFKLAATATMLVAAAVLLFARLGHYAVWDDEANTALIAEGVWQTGDTSAAIGHNIVGYRNGAILRDLKERYDPPLQFFVDAPFVGLFPRSALAARIPFAIAGLGAICLILRWLHKTQASSTTFLLTLIGLMGNVSLWLYCRQARYYALAIFFSIAVSYLYICATPTRRTALLIAAASCGLLASNYLSYAGLYSVVGLDFLIWGRHRFKLSWKDWLLVWLPQLIFGVIICSIWNPLGKVVQTTDSGGLADKLILFCYAWRDMNWCEFGVLPLIALAPMLWFARRDSWLLRAPLALLCYVVVVVILSPQKGWVWTAGRWTQNTPVYDIRYLAATIPLMIMISVLVVRTLFPPPHVWLGVIVAGIAFGTNVATCAWLGANPSKEMANVRSTLFLYLEELIDPPSDPYSRTAAWINQNTTTGESIWVLPDYMTYPLMFHAPGAIYAWQLTYPPSPQFRYLPAIQFQKRAIPNYVICFGPTLRLVLRQGAFPKGTKAVLEATIDEYWKGLYRPELFWRTFRPAKNFDSRSDLIYVLRVVPPQKP